MTYVSIQPYARGSVGGAMMDLAFGNVMDLRKQLSETVGFLPSVWAIMIKQFIPHILLILFINLARSKGGLGTYGGYSQWPYQIIGYGCMLFAAVVFLVGFTCPDLYNGLSLVDEKMVLRPTGEEAPKTSTKEVPEVPVKEVVEQPAPVNEEPATDVSEALA